jgi:phosphoribosylglycinamide formyltransferase-1
VIVVLASGKGTNFEALAKAFPGKISGLVTNIPHTGALEKAALHHIPAVTVPHMHFATRGAFEHELVKAIASFPQTQLIVLAGFMRILSPAFFTEMKKSLPSAVSINLHPAHLDEYKGARAYDFAIENRFPRWGISVHELTPQLDSGRILGTTELSLPPWETKQDFVARAQVQERLLLVQVVEQFVAQNKFEHHNKNQFTIEYGVHGS